MKKIKNEKAITLIALVITIIVLLILAGVAISMLSGDNGILKKAVEAKESTERAQIIEQIRLAESAARMKENNGDITEENLRKELDYYLKGEYEIIEAKEGETLKGWNVSSTRIEGIKEFIEGSVKIEVSVTINGEKVTEDNVAGYLGRKVSNYKGQSSVTIESTKYEVSPDYRLYYIDYEGKYGDKGTIYLKAEINDKSYDLPNTELALIKDALDSQDKIKIKQLNPELYKNENTGPKTSNDNMKVVTWLTNTEHWNKLADERYTKEINYIVGSPSVEMMMDSYNKHYNLIGDEPNLGNMTEYSPRKKLFYKYEQGNWGYQVGPGSNSQYTTCTAEYSVKTDDKINSMYYPKNSKSYWFASPNAHSTSEVMILDFSKGGFIDQCHYNDVNGLCPLVSLKSTVQLELEP